MPPIDVSIGGLETILPLLEQFYNEEEAILQAEVSARLVLPSASREQCLCCIHLRRGKPTSSYLEMRGQRHNVSLRSISAAESKRGHFEWRLEPVTRLQRPQGFSYSHPQPPQLPAPSQLSPQPSQSIAEQVFPSITNDVILIRRVSKLELSWFSSLARSQQWLLHAVFSFIDGQRSIAEVKAQYHLIPEEKIEWAIFFLLAAQYVEFKQKQSYSSE